MYETDLDISVLIGKIMATVTNNNNEEIVFKDINGDVFKMLHNQECCEDVRIDDICGNLDSLVGHPILHAEKISQNENPEGVEVPEYQECYTWTFYKIATVMGYVTIRWYGESNGYYSEEVDFFQVIDG